MFLFGVGTVGVESGLGSGRRRLRTIRSFIDQQIACQKCSRGQGVVPDESSPRDNACGRQPGCVVVGILCVACGLWFLLELGLELELRLRLRLQVARTAGHSERHSLGI